jgi:hypothetical protein
LASLILEDLTASGDSGINVRDDWDEDDIADLTVFTLQNAGRPAPVDRTGA